MNLSQLLTRQAERYVDKPFLLFERQPDDEHPGFRTNLTYRELDARVNRACRYLDSLGLRAGDVFNLHLPNCPGFVVLWFAAARLGAVMMPTNVLAAEEELHYLLEHSVSKIAFATRENLAVLRRCLKNIPTLDDVVLCDPYTEEPESGSFEAAAAQFSDQPWTCPAAPTDLAAIMYTSGTTSKPKGVMVTHANYIKAGATVADAIELDEDDRQFVVLPLFHGNAQYYSTMSALLRGASIALMDRFSASRYFDKCIEYRCTVASLFAAPMRMILAQAHNPLHRDNRLRIVIFAQSLTDAQLDEWRQRFDAPLAQLWGMTETMGPPLMNPLRGERRNQSIGKPVGGYEIALLDDDAKPVPRGQAGEIAVRGIPGETIMAGYFNNAAATADTIRGEWLFTGDNAVQDEAGYFRFIDRKKDMIKRSGENVSAGEVESVVLQHPDVFECAVIGLPDEMRDESIVAVVVPLPGRQPSAAEIVEFCAVRLAGFRVPERVLVRDSLPKTSVGKIQKHLIRNELIAPKS